MKHDPPRLLNVVDDVRVHVEGEAAPSVPGALRRLRDRHARLHPPTDRAMAKIVGTVERDASVLAALAHSARRRLARHAGEEAPVMQPIFQRAGSAQQCHKLWRYRNEAAPPALAPRARDADPARVHVDVGERDGEGFADPEPRRLEEREDEAPAWGARVLEDQANLARRWGLDFVPRCAWEADAAIPGGVRVDAGVVEGGAEDVEVPPHRAHRAPRLCLLRDEGQHVIDLHARDGHAEDGATSRVRDASRVMLNRPGS